MRLLLAEDEADLAEALGVFFEKNHFSVDIVHDGRTACEYAESSVYDVIILDVMMPYMDGFTALRRMRADGNKTPIMMLTARGETRDRIEGFDSGADDYLPKPFDPDELLVRVRAMLRRSDTYRPSILSFGDLTLDPATGDLSCGSSRVRLSGREFQLMELLMRSPGMLFSAEYLMEKVWGWDSEAEPAGGWGIYWRPEHDPASAQTVHSYCDAFGCAGASGADANREYRQFCIHEPGYQ